ncbi:MAG: hypothetical protein LDL07_03245 [Desulfarculus sp.]|nr:hypothetical protein [Desulfarculus sp.]
MPETNGVDLIAVERRRQVEVEGFDAARDDRWRRGELAQAAAYYAFPGDDVATGVTHKWGTGSFSVSLAKLMFPAGWSLNGREKSRHDRIRQLTIAGALIAAEIDRLLREQARANQPPARRHQPWCPAEDNSGAGEPGTCTCGVVEAERA